MNKKLDPEKYTEEILLFEKEEENKLSKFIEEQNRYINEYEVNLRKQMEDELEEYKKKIENETEKELRKYKVQVEQEFKEKLEKVEKNLKAIENDINKLVVKLKDELLKIWQ